MYGGDGFTIRIFVPNGDPEGVRVVDGLTSTGLAIAFPRDRWPAVKSRSDFAKGGVYILVGYKADDDELLTLYIGQGDGTRNRIDSHYEQKEFWNWGIVFCSKASDAGLNQAHIAWLEHALVKGALAANRSHRGGTCEAPFAASWLPSGRKMTRFCAPAIAVKTCLRILAGGLHLRLRTLAAAAPTRKNHSQSGR